MPGPIRLKLDETKIRFVPRLVIWSLMVASVPALTAIMMMTAATPMMIPSMVSRARTLFLPIASQAIRSTSMGRMAHLLFAQPQVIIGIVDNRVDAAVFQMDSPLGMRGDDRIVRDDDEGGSLPM